MAERDRIDLWAVHPGGRSILDAVGKRSGTAGACARYIAPGIVVFRAICPPRP